jgi:glycosyltransferase involved in cell wall biosynthesis
MTPADILVTNRNSREAIQLCVESVRAYTPADAYNLIVYDDCSDNDLDLPYLREAQDKGWLRLIEGRERALHGGALNVLLNEVSTADYAVLLDCDIEIKRAGWLADLLALIADDPLAIGAVHCLPAKIRGPGTWVAPFGEWWFGALNMRAYHDGMAVDWRPVILRDKGTIARVVPVELRQHEIQEYIFDVGCKLFHKVRTDNPKGYHFVSPLPEEIRSIFRHYLQVSHHLGSTSDAIITHVNGKLAEMRALLNTIRKTGGKK